MSNVPTDDAAETANDSLEGAGDVECIAQGNPQRRIVETLSQVQGGRPRNIPKQVEKGFEIPIMITNVNQTA
eukprot:9503426-Pyramimonas_sp.AAC.1